MQCGTDFLHLSLELTRLLLLDGGEVGVPHEGDQVGEEHPVLRSHQVDVHNLWDCPDLPVGQQGVPVTGLNHIFGIVMTGSLEPVQEVESEEEEGWREDKSICENPKDSRGQATAWEQPVKKDVEVVGDGASDKTSVDEERSSNVHGNSLRLGDHLGDTRPSARDYSAGDAFCQQGAHSQKLPVNGEDGLRLKVAVSRLGSHV